MDLREAEDIKKRWQEYTEELYKKDLHNQDNHDGVITHLESDILDCEVKWALESITTNKASGGDEIPIELFQILKDNVWNIEAHRVYLFAWASKTHARGSPRRGTFRYSSGRLWPYVDGVSPLSWGFIWLSM